jgi:hypothetical protein
MKQVLILAGNWQEYRCWCYENDVPQSRAVPITSPVNLMGRHLPADGKLVRVGTWKSRSDLSLIEQAIEIATWIPEGQMHMDFEEGT